MASYLVQTYIFYTFEAKGVTLWDFGVKLVFPLTPTFSLFFVNK